MKWQPNSPRLDTLEPKPEKLPLSDFGCQAIHPLLRSVAGVLGGGGSVCTRDALTIATIPTCTGSGILVQAATTSTKLGSRRPKTDMHNDMSDSGMP